LPTAVKCIQGCAAGHASSIQHLVNFSDILGGAGDSFAGKLIERLEEIKQIFGALALQIFRR
jgi:hypothetical protein